jgi:hypothetical protein
MSNLFTFLQDKYFQHKISKRFKYNGNRRRYLVKVYVDGMLKSSNYDGSFNESQFELRYYFPVIITERDYSIMGYDPDTAFRMTKINEDRENKGKSKMYDISRGIAIFSSFKIQVIAEMQSNGYIEKTKEYYRLTERGKLAKELGGHEQYKKHRYREINLIKNQTWINRGLFAAALLTAIIPFIIAKIYPPTITVNVAPQQNQIRTHSDSLLLQHFVEDYIPKKKNQNK